jgi:release factor glutamine methyltransferase
LLDFAPSAVLSTCLSWARDRMEEAGADSPWLTALVLLEHATGLGREQVLAHPDRALSQGQLTAFRALVARRCRREPLAYILGTREFYGRQFAVSPAVLIPRPETEGLVDLALNRMDQWMADHADEQAPILVDVGTGSGAIAITLLAQRQRWTGIATDIEAGALRIARQNAVQHGVAERLELVSCELATGIRRAVPLVVANLPYVPTTEIEELEPEVATFEPRTALDGGPDGTAIIAAFLPSLRELLVTGGSAILEFGDGQGSTLRAQARENLPDAAVSVEQDPSGAERYLVIDRHG